MVSQSFCLVASEFLFRKIVALIKQPCNNSCPTEAYIMNRIWLLVFLFFLSPIEVFAIQSVPQDIKKTVIFIYPLDKDGDSAKFKSNSIAKLDKGEKPMPVGTGFLAGVKIPSSKDQYIGYIVTNKHVIKSPDGKSFLPAIALRLNLNKGGVENVAVKIITEGVYKNVFSHKDESVDLAVILIPPGVNQLKYDVSVVPQEWITSKEDYKSLNIAEGSEVFFTGLFVSHIGEQRNYPIVRFGRVALVTDEKVNWNGALTDLYLMEVSSHGGNSGSPVFFFLGPNREPGKIIIGGPVIKLAGIMQGYFNELGQIGFMQPTRSPQAEQQQGQQPKSPPVPVTILNSGIAAVVPAYKLQEILFGEELIQKRKQN
jgi:Trypsin-like peptidase domain